LPLSHHAGAIERRIVQVHATDHTKDPYALNKLVLSGARPEESHTKWIACWELLNEGLKPFELFCFFRDGHLHPRHPINGAKIINLDTVERQPKHSFEELFNSSIGHPPSGVGWLFTHPISPFEVKHACRNDTFKPEYINQAYVAC
jgi:hypothetical protein